ncbi:hypothetical protein F5X99DRAFT_236686 [Biscogniauxia marginata]|nr:hypothetical protein F5X99DRAFT_236686 [Biscogniauxia marginata]
MAPSTADSVTVDRAFLETLLRRTNSGDHDGHASASVGERRRMVSVPKEEYDRLLLVARQYANLKRNLMNGGVVEETISLLSQDEASAPQAGADSTTTHSYKREEIDDGGARLIKKSHRGVSPSSNAPYTTNGRGFAPRQVGRHQDWADPHPTGGDMSPVHSADGPATNMNNERTGGPLGNAPRPLYPKICRRTISLSGLPDNTTHWDITSVVRGGLLLNVFVRAGDHIALVSFLHEEDAVRFHEHARKHNIYIKNKRISIRWADRQFHLAPHVASKITIGATRNLIIRRCDLRHTEDGIREDLEHIHNLVVVKVDFIHGSCYIKTNSVQNAMFARTCMMSRFKYKGSKIEWDVDECDQPIEIIQKTTPKPQQSLPAKKPLDMQNRFDTLRLDDGDDETDDKFDTSSELPSTVNVTA